MKQTTQLLICGAIAAVTCGCGRHKPPGSEDVPPGLTPRAGIYADINPRWSHDGNRIAFLRATPDRHLQLHITDEDLARPLPLLDDELVMPDRPYSASLARYCSPDSLAWSPDDRKIAFERVEWFTFADGERLPGTGLWTLELRTGRVQPLALHSTPYTGLYYYFHTPQWSPDGRYLAFVGEGINGQRTVFTRAIGAQTAADAQPRFDNYQDSDWCVWQPRIASSSSDPDGSTQQIGLAMTGAGSHSSTFSAMENDAPTLTFRQGIRLPLIGTPTDTLRRLRPGSPERKESGELWRIRSRDFRKMLPSGTDPAQGISPRIGNPVWSPDGSRLVFTLTPDANDFTRYELWTIDRDGGNAHCVSPHNGHGYVAPVWIGNRLLGALSPKGSQYDVTTIDPETGTIQTLGMIESADCDWSPDRSRIVYALPANDVLPTGSATTLRTFETRLEVPTAIARRD